MIGQPEAVEHVVERVALIKAGLTDPDAPVGVLLFVGPTGTGKTEIAKALAEFLFGSADRMIRLDMSEYQNPGVARRMLGDGEPTTRSLVAAIRSQPFSVVLLDEFEKADPSVWDLFLQVFDDGRLTDPRGEHRRLPPRRDHHDLEHRRVDPDGRTGRASRAAATRFVASSVKAAL